MIVSIRHIRAALAHDYWWAQCIAAWLAMTYGVSNMLAPPSPFKLQFLQPLMQLLPEQAWNAIFMVCGFLQLVLLLHDGNRWLRYVGAIPCAFLFGSLIGSMLISGQTFPARFTMMGTGFLIEFGAVWAYSPCPLIWWRQRA